MCAGNFKDETKPPASVESRNYHGAKIILYTVFVALKHKINACLYSTFLCFVIVTNSIFIVDSRIKVIADINWFTVNGIVSGIYASVYCIVQFYFCLMGHKFVGFGSTRYTFTINFGGQNFDELIFIYTIHI